MATPQQLKTSLRQYFEEVVHKGNLEAIPDFMASDVVFRGPYTAQPVHGIKGFTELIAMFHSAFADLQITEEAMIVEGDTVATRWTASGVHQGEFMGTGPSGQPFAFTGVGFYRFAGDKIVEVWSENHSIEILKERSVA